jgi:hypothetical protein
MHRIPARPSLPSASGRWRAATVAGGKARGLPPQVPTLFLALAAPVASLGGVDSARSGGAARAKQEQEQW